MRTAGLFALLVPAELGGCEADPVQFIQVVEEISRADGSTGWCVANGAICAGMAGAHLGDTSVRDVFAAQRPPLFAGGFTPRGRALPEASGFRIDGRWPLRYIGRSRNSSPSEGSSSWHAANQRAIVDQVFEARSEAREHDRVLSKQV